MSILLTKGEAVGLPQAGKQVFGTDASGVPFLLNSDGSRTAIGGGGATPYSPSGGDDAAGLAALVTSGARSISLLPGVFKWQSQLSVNFDGVHLEGAGQGTTTIEIDDATLVGGDAIKLNSVLDFSLRGVTMTAKAARSAGAYIKVLGKNHITATPDEPTQQYVIEDVNMDSFFDGISFNDGPSSQGAWGGHINRMQMRKASAGGTFIDVNSPSGGQHYISNIKMYGADTFINANRPLAGLRYRGGADIELYNITAVYLRSGLLVDPPNGQAANVIVATACDWDNMTLAAVKVTPAVGGTVLGIELNGGWGYSPPANTVPCVQIDGGCQIQVRGGQYMSNWQAVRIFGPAKNVTVQGLDTSNATSCAIYVSSNATDFSVLGNRCGIIPGTGVTPPLGMQIDAGCDHYNVTGNTFRECTTKITNTPGLAANQRIVQDNVIV